MNVTRSFRPLDLAALIAKMSVVDPLITAVPLENAIADFLMELKIGNRSKKTTYYYNCHLQDLLKFSTSNGLALTVKDIGAQQVKQFLAEKADKPWVLVARYVSLRAFWNWAIKQNMAVINPILSINVPKKPKRIIPAISIEDFKRLLDCLPRDTFLGKRNRAMLMMLYDTGLRLDEMAKLRISNVDIEQGLIKVIGKGNKERMARIGDATRKELWTYLKLHGGKYDAVWLTEEKKPITTSTIAVMLRRLREETGISCSAHKFRHSFAINMLRSGCDVFSLQQMLGHTSLEMVKNYTRTLNQDDAIKAHIKFSPVDRLL